jgi:hypothetical protein
MPGHLGGQPEGVEGTYGVAGQVGPGALGRWGGGAFDDLDPRPPTPQGARHREAGDADDEYSHPPLHASHAPSFVVGLGEPHLQVSR